MKTVHIDAELIKNQDDLHRELKNKCGFPDYYGMNWNAFIDCMSNDVPELCIEFEGVEDFSKRLPAEFFELIACVAIVNKDRNCNHLFKFL